MKKKKNWAGCAVTCLGILLLSAALLLFCYNVWDSRRAEQSMEVILQEYTKEEQKMLEDSSAADGDIPDYQLDPEMEMPEIALESAGGAACIGTLEIPSVDLTLPVMSEWSYPLLKLAPCRYAGSAYQENLVIAAHNYKTHFRKIKTLPEGSEVRFTDAAGNVFVYHVAVVEALTAQSVEDMISGEWPLTLFTCTADGKNRVTVRCE